MKIKIVIFAIVSFCLIIVYFSLQTKVNYQVIIQAGHEGRSVGNTGSELGSNKEVKWNIYVANMVADILNASDIKTLRIDADAKNLKSKIAVAIHFDGSKKICHSGASVGYKDNNSKSLATLWKSLYKPYFPFKWHQDNFTQNLSNYYAYKNIKADKFIVLELGEITCKNQVKWLKPRLKTIARLIAYTIAKDLGFGLDKPLLK